MRFKKGISMLMLVITIIIIIILVSTITITVGNSISNARIVAFAEDLKAVEESTTIYYQQHDDFPVLGGSKAYSKAEILQFVPEEKRERFIEELQLNNDDVENENLGAFYKIDLAKLDVEKTTRGLQLDDNGDTMVSDIFVVSYPSLTVYYLYGLEEKDNIYFSLSSKISRAINLKNIELESEAPVTMFKLRRMVNVAKLQDVTVKREVKTWSNKLNLVIEADMKAGEVLNFCIDDMTMHPLRTNLGYNTIYFEENFKEVFLNSNSTSFSTGVTADEIEYFLEKPQEERKIYIVKKKDGQVTGKLDVELANYDVELPVRTTKAVITSNEYSNSISFKVADATSGVKEVRYEILRVFDENANTKLYYDGVTNYETSYMYSRGKKANISSDGFVEIEVPKDVEGIQIRIFDKAGNASEVINENTTLPVYVGINEKNPTRDYVLLNNVIKTTEKFDFATISLSVDGKNFSSESNLDLKNIGNGIYTSTVECENLSNVDKKIYVKINVYKNNKLLETRCKEISVYDKVENLGEGTRSKANSKYNKPYVPLEFKYLEGTVNTGYVIKDVSNGNEFVWVPVKDMSEYKRGVIADSRELSEYIEEDNEINNSIKASVEKYGGFYIGRYETRMQGDVSFSENVSDDLGTLWLGEITPVIKNTASVWNYISKEYAEEVASKMYTGTAKSTLINSYAYDTTLNWLISSGSKTKEEVSINSVSWGNYIDAVIEDISNYIKADGIEDVTLEDDELMTKDAEDIVIINALKSDYTKANNIYDLAGNVYEWTTEMYDGKSIGRGGRFDSYGNERPAAYRFTCEEKDAGNGDVGFRVMLYLE